MATAEVATTGLTSSATRRLIRDLAAAEVPRAELARRNGITRSAVSQFAQRHAAEIDAAKARLTDEFAGLWIARKGDRIAAYEADYERSLDHPKADYFEQIRTRTAIAQAVAEELGQLPPRQTTTVIAVTHIIENVDLGALK